MNIIKGKTAFLKDCRENKMKICPLLKDEKTGNYRPMYWHQITSVSNNRLMLNHHRELKLPRSDMMEYVTYSDSKGMFLRIYSQNMNGSKELKHLYALRTVS